MTNSLRMMLAEATVAVAAATALVLLAYPAHATGQVEVSFVHPEAFTDAGSHPIERDRALSSLADHLKTLGRRLPDGQTLRVEVLDVDLAGDQNPLILRDVRVLRGRADVPRINLRWTLAQGAQTLRAGEDRISDLSYLSAAPHIGAIGSDLPYEKRMLSAWFDERFGSPRAKR